jgi:hypothetical protein
MLSMAKQSYGAALTASHMGHLALEHTVTIMQLRQRIADLQNEINITNRKIAAPTWWPWLDMFLNVLLVLVLLYALYVVVIKLMYVHPVATQIQTPY